MKWFKERKKKMEFIQSYIPTSKAQLIQIAMWYHKGDLHKAQEMVDFYTKNMELPDFDPVAPTFLQQFKVNASEFYSWVKNNQSEILQGYQFIQSIIKNKGELPLVTPQESQLPPINE